MTIELQDKPTKWREGQSLGKALLTYDQAAGLLGCTPRLVRKLVETRELASIKIGGARGGLVRIDPIDLNAYIGRRRREAVN